MSITTSTRDKVARVLQESAVGRGMTIAQLRRQYPARAVRRTSVLVAVRDLESMGKVAWNGRRVRWAAAEYDVERVMGEDVRRIERHRATTPQDRVATSVALSRALVRRR